MADRIDSDDLRFVLMSVTIQREIGGSLAELFQTVSDTVRERQQFRRKVHALTAMGRASAYVLIALPFVTAALIALIGPGYLAPLVHHRHGSSHARRDARDDGDRRSFILKKIVDDQGVMPNAADSRFRLPRRARWSSSASS